MDTLSPKALDSLFAVARWTEQDARRALLAWSRSGLSLCAFARAHGCSPQRLYQWHRRLDLHPEAPPLHFLELPAPAPAAPLELHWPSGLRLRCEGAVDPASLRTLLLALREVGAC